MIVSEGLIEGFEPRRLPGNGIEIDALVGGSGPPLLLLHGYPQTRLIWRLVAPVLADRFTLVMPDLRGYGRSEKPDCRTGELYAKRLMAQDQIATMKALGYDRFMIAGHDRGGRVAYRLALDVPQAVEKVAVIDIIPTADVWKAGPEAAMGLFHWQFLAQPYPMPERLVGEKSDYFLSWLLERAAERGFVFDPDSMDDYLTCFRDPATIQGSCSDYRAGWSIDHLHDKADRGNRFIEAPLLVLWGRDGGVSKATPLEAWRAWGANVSGEVLPGGHFVPEEAPQETARALGNFFSS